MMDELLKFLDIMSICIKGRAISKWLYRSLAPADQLLFDQLTKSSQSKVIAELDVLLNSFIIKKGLAEQYILELLFYLHTFFDYS